MQTDLFFYSFVYSDQTQSFKNRLGYAHHSRYLGFKKQELVSRILASRIQETLVSKSYYPKICQEFQEQGKFDKNFKKIKANSLSLFRARYQKKPNPLCQENPRIFNTSSNQVPLFFWWIVL